MKEPSLRCQRRDGPLLEKREKWGTPVSDWSELRDEPHNHRTLGEGGHPPARMPTVEWGHFSKSARSGAPQLFLCR
jgi:hypothetical protein